MDKHRLIDVPQEGNAEALLPKLRKALEVLDKGDYSVEERRINTIRVLRETVFVLTYGHDTDTQWLADKLINRLDRLVRNGLYDD